MIHWHGYRPSDITDARAIQRHRQGETRCNDCPKPAGCKPSEEMIKARFRLQVKRATESET